MKGWLWRRRNYLINKDFQFRYMGQIIFGMLVMALIIAFTVYYTTWTRIMDEFYSIPRIASQFAPLFASVNQTLLALLLLFMLVAAVLSIFMSHSIAGPMYRFEKTLEAIRQGDLTLRIGLRKTDEFKHLAGLINDVVTELNRNLSDDCRLIGELMKLSEDIQEAGSREGKPLPPAVAKDIGRLQDTVTHLKQNLGRYKL